MCEPMHTHVLAHERTRARRKSGACWVELKSLNVSERIVIPSNRRVGVIKVGVTLLFIVLGVIRKYILEPNKSTVSVELRNQSAAKCKEADVTPKSKYGGGTGMGPW